MGERERKRKLEGREIDRQIKRKKSIPREKDRVNERVKVREVG